MKLKTLGLVFLGMLSVSKVTLAQSENNFVTVHTPSGSGYLWCDVSPVPGKATTQNPLSESALKGVSAFLATYCVNVSGMNCHVNTTKSGTRDTDLWWLKMYALKYDKSGKINGDPPNCTDPGIVQILIDYTYQLKCHVGSTPPKDRQISNERIC